MHVRSWRSTYAGIVPAPFLASLSETDRALQWREWLTLDLPIYVAESDGEIVGFASGGPIRDPIPGYDAELFAIYLLDRVQRQGIGSALLRALIEVLHSRGLTAMIAWVLESNSSCSFYEQTGAHALQTKQIEIGGAPLAVRAYGWPALKTAP